MSHLTLIPAYGRDYRSKAAALADWIAGKDFRSVGYGGEGYINLEGALRAGVRTVNVRYQGLTKVAVIKVAPRSATLVVARALGLLDKEVTP